MEEKILNIIATVLKISVEEISTDTEIGEPDEWDSLHNMQIFAEIEQAFNIKIPAESVIDLEDVSDIIKLVEELS